MTYFVNQHSSTQEAYISFPEGCQVANFIRRYKRFSVEVRLDGQEVWCHSNNTGSMLGLLHKHALVLLSPATHPKRKLAWTQEALWLPRQRSPLFLQSHALVGTDGFWVGVNTGIPNALLAKAFAVGCLSFAQGYTQCIREAKRGDSRLDACIKGDGHVPLWVECKNVTLVEDQVAYFPDAVTERGQKHLRELMSIVKSGERAAMFYVVQRPDARCFAPADFIDPAYAALFWEAYEAGVEVYVYTACVGMQGIRLGHTLPVLPYGG